MVESENNSFVTPSVILDSSKDHQWMLCLEYQSGSEYLTERILIFFYKLQKAPYSFSRVPQPGFILKVW